VRSKKQTLFPKHMKIMEQLGENIRLARKRRKLTTILVSERAGVDRSTLYEIERGNPSVSMGAYFNTLHVFGLQVDFLKLASDDEFGRKLQDLELLRSEKDSKMKIDILHGRAKVKFSKDFKSAASEFPNSTKETIHLNSTVTNMNKGKYRRKTFIKK
jgi:transcriptional regulator with XRE-family HTH domain